MMHPIDCHVILRPEFKPRFFSSLLPLLEAEPVNVHVMASDCAYGTARLRGFEAGEAPYVTFVDDDDTFLPGMFEAMLRTYRLGPPDAVGVYVDAVHCDAGGLRGMGNSQGITWCPRCMVEAFPHMEGSVLMERGRALQQKTLLLGRQSRWADQVLYAKLATRGRWIKPEYAYYRKRIDTPNALSPSRVLFNETRFEVAKVLSSKGSIWNSDCKDCLQRARAQSALSA
jgi:glycosyltransferase involved in cell wall biosynthesis